jgi:bacillithiol system protein YtxJ
MSDDNPGMRDLSDEAAAEALIASPAPAWILKHSATCGISASAYDEVQSYLAAHPDEALGLVVVQRRRPLSNWLAQRLGRVHQSPQLFLVQGGKVLWSASHWGITAEAMGQARAAAV